MLRPLIAFALLASAIISFAPTLAAQEVPNDSYWSSGGATVHIDVTQDPSDSSKVWTTATDSSGFSNPAGGSAGANSTYNNPTAFSSGLMTTQGGAEYKVSGGRVWKKNSRGHWVKMKKVKKPRRVGGSSGNASVSGTSNSPGDDVVGLPQ